MDSNSSPLWTPITSIVYRYVQVWIIRKGWNQSLVGWFLESLQQTLSF